MAFSRKESELVVQLPVFADGIAANISLYQMTQPDSDAISAAVEEFVEKYTVWNNPATRTAGSLEAKDAAKFAALGICRVFYRQIQINDRDGEMLGLRGAHDTRPIGEVSDIETLTLQQAFDGTSDREVVFDEQCARLRRIRFVRGRNDPVAAARLRDVQHAVCFRQQIHDRRAALERRNPGGKGYAEDGGPRSKL